MNSKLTIFIINLLWGLLLSSVLFWALLPVKPLFLSAALVLVFFLVLIVGSLALTALVESYYRSDGHDELDQ